MEKLQKIEIFETHEQAKECYENLYGAYEASLRNEEYYKNLYDYECKRAKMLEAKLTAITSIVNI